jgi:hypothetical protein
VRKREKRKTTKERSAGEEKEMKKEGGEEERKEWRERGGGGGGRWMWVIALSYPIFIFSLFCLISFYFVIANTDSQLTNYSLFGILF